MLKRTTLEYLLEKCASQNIPTRMRHKDMKRRWIGYELKVCDSKPNLINGRLLRDSPITRTFIEINLSLSIVQFPLV